jgi:hypothetical protein
MANKLFIIDPDLRRLEEVFDAPLEVYPTHLDKLTLNTETAARTLDDLGVSTELFNTSTWDKRSTL